MRKSILLAALVVVACAKEEAPATDTAAVAAAPTPAAPAALTPADVAGTWTGTITATPPDTGTTRFTAVTLSDSTGKFIAEGAKDSVAYAVRFDADSMIATSVAYTDPTMPKGTPQVMFKSVGRLRDGKLSGNSMLVVASKPDSVLSRSSWEATRAP